MSHFQPLEVVDRGSETQLQVGENLNCKIQRSSNICMLISALATSDLKLFYCIYKEPGMNHIQPQR